MDSPQATGKFPKSAQLVKNEVNTASAPLEKANEFAQRLNQLSKANFDATQITLAWEEESQKYTIKAGEEVLLTLDELTILPDTTGKRAQDALQITNRLRRLLGDAQPLTKLPVKGEFAYTPTTQVKQSKRGVASWYGPGFHGRRTANGERYNQYGHTAAHRYLPFGTRVRVTNLRNGRSVVVRINDRGPHVRGRIIDLSKGAAAAIGMFSTGTAPVAIEVLQ